MNTSPTEPPSPEGPDVASAPARRYLLSRRAFAGGAAAATGVSLFGGWASSPASAASSTKPVPHGFGSVSTAPRLPRGFANTFRSHFIWANGIRQHVVSGGDGPPLLLVHGWPTEMPSAPASGSTERGMPTLPRTSHARPCRSRSPCSGSAERTAGPTFRETQ